ncbi:DNA cytosine methyltransferase [Rhizobium leguminosarum]|uniref:DNA cytosine methyltransferase n=1 Tax=Rhizobium leguminosarum TaxID=384 RepID=UPI0013BE7CC0|nr:DNA cytosine methyltransferase [Rhizobium leguminosarum]MBY5325399.1 DNA (cytosine-5-)-methyltransferase [Rhizobium leguminosarum]NEH68646.1 DNA (cytosine-5-)-methyltransferase [Rhizobium leguminosarum]
MPDFISLFAGAGGLDIGLEAAGWNCRYASDIDDAAVVTMQANQAARTSIGGRSVFDGTFIEKADVRQLTGKGILNSIAAVRGAIPLLAGGPPCQSWSSAGHQLGFQDPRGRLWSDFVRLADELDVRFMLFENVRGLLTARGEDGVPGSALTTIRSKLLEVGFHTSVSLLNAADYGIPQRRVRLFIIGYRSGDEPSFPLPTHTKTLADVDRRPWVSMRNALAAIAPVAEGEVIRPSGKLRDELEQLEPGSGVKSMGKPEATRPGGHWGYKQGAFVADPSLPARTVTAGAQQDWVKDPQHGIRRLAPRECAALQTFPKDYIWPKKLADQYRLIGNSVPPGLATIVGSGLLDHFEKKSSTTVKVSVGLSPLDARLEAAIAYTKREEMRNGPSRRAAPMKRKMRMAAG